MQSSHEKAAKEIRGTNNNEILASANKPNIKSVWDKSELTYAEVLTGLRKSAKNHTQRNVNEEKITTTEKPPSGHNEPSTSGDKTEKYLGQFEAVTHDLINVHKNKPKIVNNRDDYSKAKKAKKPKLKQTDTADITSSNHNRTKPSSFMPIYKTVAATESVMSTNENYPENKPKIHESCRNETNSTSISYADVLKGIESAKNSTFSASDKGSSKIIDQYDFNNDSLSNNTPATTEKHAEESIKKEAISFSSQRKRKPKEYAKSNESCLARKSQIKNTDAQQTTEAGSPMLMEVCDVDEPSSVYVAGTIFKANPHKLLQDAKSTSSTEVDSPNESNNVEKIFVEDMNSLVSVKLSYDTRKPSSSRFEDMNVVVPSQNHSTPNASIAGKPENNIPSKKNSKRKIKKSPANNTTKETSDIKNENFGHVDTAYRVEHLHSSSVNEPSTNSCGKKINEASLNKGNKKTKVEKIRKSNSAKISAMLEQHKYEFERELNTSIEQDNKYTTNLLTEDFSTATENSTDAFKSSLIFEDYEFMHKYDALDESNNMSVIDQNPPCDMDIVNSNNTRKPSTEETNVTASHGPNSQMSLSSTKTSLTSKDNHDSKEMPTQNNGWRDKRQKISMITHEEYHLNPISHMRLELPVVTAKIVINNNLDSQNHIYPNSGQFLQDNADLQTEEVLNIEPPFFKEQHVATEVSVLDTDIASLRPSKPNAVLVKQLSTTEHKNYSASSSTSDTVRFGEDFSTTTSSCIYKTTTILYGVSSQQHVIEEHYTHPLIVEQLSADSNTIEEDVKTAKCNPIIEATKSVLHSPIKTQLRLDKHLDKAISKQDEIQSNLVSNVIDLASGNCSDIRDCYESQDETSIFSNASVIDKQAILKNMKDESLEHDAASAYRIFTEENGKIIDRETESAHDEMGQGSKNIGHCKEFTPVPQLPATPATIGMETEFVLYTNDKVDSDMFNNKSVNDEDNILTEMRDEPFTDEEDTKDNNICQSFENVENNKGSQSIKTKADIGLVSKTPDETINDVENVDIAMRDESFIHDNDASMKQTSIEETENIIDTVKHTLDNKLIHVSKNKEDHMSYLVSPQSTEKSVADIGVVLNKPDSIDSQEEISIPGNEVINDENNSLIQMKDDSFIHDGASMKQTFIEKVEKIMVKDTPDIEFTQASENKEDQNDYLICPQSTEKSADEGSDLNTPDSIDYQDDMNILKDESVSDEENVLIQMRDESFLNDEAPEYQTFTVDAEKIVDAVKDASDIELTQVYEHNEDHTICPHSSEKSKSDFGLVSNVLDSTDSQAEMNIVEDTSINDEENVVIRMRDESFIHDEASDNLKLIEKAEKFPVMVEETPDNELTQASVHYEDYKNNLICTQSTEKSADQGSDLNTPDFIDSQDDKNILKDESVSDEENVLIQMRDESFLNDEAPEYQTFTVETEKIVDAVKETSDIELTQVYEHNEDHTICPQTSEKSKSNFGLASNALDSKAEMNIIEDTSINDEENDVIRMRDESFIHDEASDNLKLIEEAEKFPVMVEETPGNELTQASVHYEDYKNNLICTQSTEKSADQGSDLNTPDFIDSQDDKNILKDESVSDEENVLIQMRDESFLNDEAPEYQTFTVETEKIVDAVKETSDIELTQVYEHNEDHTICPQTSEKSKSNFGLASNALDSKAEMNIIEDTSINDEENVVIRMRDESFIHDEASDNLKLIEEAEKFPVMVEETPGNELTQASVHYEDYKNNLICTQSTEKSADQGSDLNTPDFIDSQDDKNILKDESVSNEENVLIQMRDESFLNDEAPEYQTFTVETEKIVDAVKETSDIELTQVYEHNEDHTICPQSSEKSKSEFGLDSNVFDSTDSQAEMNIIEDTSLNDEKNVVIRMRDESFIHDEASDNLKLIEEAEKFPVMVEETPGNELTQASVHYEDYKNNLICTQSTEKSADQGSDLNTPDFIDSQDDKNILKDESVSNEENVLIQMIDESFLNDEAPEYQTFTVDAEKIVDAVKETSDIELTQVYEHNEDHTICPQTSEKSKSNFGLASNALDSKAEMNIIEDTSINDEENVVIRMRDESFIHDEASDNLKLIEEAEKFPVMVEETPGNELTQASVHYEDYKNNLICTQSTEKSADQGSDLNTPDFIDSQDDKNILKDESVSNEENVLIQMIDESFLNDEAPEYQTFTVDAEKIVDAVKDASDIELTQVYEHNEDHTICPHSSEKSKSDFGLVSNVFDSTDSQAEMNIVEDTSINDEENVVIRMRDESFIHDEASDNLKLIEEAEKFPVMVEETPDNELTQASVHYEDYKNNLICTQSTEKSADQGSDLNTPDFIDSQDDKNILKDESVSDEENVLIQMRDESFLNDEAPEYQTFTVETEKIVDAVKETSDIELTQVYEHNEDHTICPQTSEKSKSNFGLASNALDSKAEMNIIEDTSINDEENDVIRMRDESFIHDEASDNLKLIEEAEKFPVMVEETPGNELTEASVHYEDYKNNLICTQSTEKSADQGSDLNTPDFIDSQDDKNILKDESVSNEENVLIQMRDESFLNDEAPEYQTFTVETEKIVDAVKDTSDIELTQVYEHNEDHTICPQSSEESKSDFGLVLNVLDSTDSQAEMNIVEDKSLNDEENVVLRMRDESFIHDEASDNLKLIEEAEKFPVMVEETPDNELTQASVHYEDYKNNLICTQSTEKSADQGSDLNTPDFIDSQDDKNILEDESVSDEENVLIQMRDESFLNDEAPEYQTFTVETEKIVDAVKETSDIELTQVYEHNEDHTICPQSSEKSKSDFGLASNALDSKAEMNIIEDTSINDEENDVIRMRDESFIHDESSDNLKLIEEAEKFPVMVEETPDNELTQASVHYEDYKNNLICTQSTEKSADQGSDLNTPDFIDSQDDKNILKDESVSDEENVLIQMRDESFLNDEAPEYQTFTVETEKIVNAVKDTSDINEDHTICPQSSEKSKSEFGLDSNVLDSTDSQAEMNIVEDTSINDEENVVIRMRDESFIHDEASDNLKLIEEAEEFPVMVEETPGNELIQASVDYEDHKNNLIYTQSTEKSAEGGSDLNTPDFIDSQDDKNILEDESVSDEENVLIQMRDESFLNDEAPEYQTFTVETEKIVDAVKDTSDIELTQVYEHNEDHTICPQSSEKSKSDFGLVSNVLDSTDSKAEMNIIEDISINDEENVVIRMRDESFIHDGVSDNLKLIEEAEKFPVMVKETPDNELTQASVHYEDYKNNLICTQSSEKSADEGSDLNTPDFIDSQDDKNIPKDESVSDEENVLIEIRDESLRNNEASDYRTFIEEGEKTIVTVKNTPDNNLSQASENNEVHKDHFICPQSPENAENAEIAIVPGKEYRNRNSEHNKNVHHNYWMYHDAELLNALPNNVESVHKYAVEHIIPSSYITEKDTLLTNSSLNDLVSEKCSPETQNITEKRSESLKYELQNMDNYIMSNDSEVKHILLKVAATIDKQTSNNTPEEYLTLEKQSSTSSQDNNNIVAPTLTRENIKVDKTNYTIDSAFSEDAQFEIQNRDQSFLYEQTMSKDYWKYVDAEKMYFMTKLPDIASLNGIYHEEIDEKVNTNKETISNVTSTDIGIDMVKKLCDLDKEVNKLCLYTSDGSIDIDEENQFQFNEQIIALNVLSNCEDTAKAYYPDNGIKLRDINLQHERRKNHKYWEYFDAERLYILYNINKKYDANRTQSETNDDCNSYQISHANREVETHMDTHAVRDETYNQPEKISVSPTNDEIDTFNKIIEKSCMESTTTDNEIANSSYSMEEPNQETTFHANYRPHEEESHNTTCSYQIDSFWNDKYKYDDAEATNIKTLESLNRCVVPEQDIPMLTKSTVDSSVDDQKSTQLTQASNNRLTKSSMQTPAMNTNPSVFPPNPINQISLGTARTVNLSNPNETMDDFTTSKQTHSESVENILQSLLNEELKMNNLPYDNMNSLIKGLQILIDKLSVYKEQNRAISMSLPQNAEHKIRESVRLVNDRIDFLRQRAYDGLDKIQNSLKLREQRKSELEAYSKLLDEIEYWISTTSIHLTDFDNSSEKHILEELLHHNTNLLTMLREKENHSKTIHQTIEHYLIYNDMRDKTEALREGFSNIIRIIREKALILEDNIQRLKPPTEPNSLLKVDNEMQTSPLISMDSPESISVTHQEASAQANLDRPRDDLIIIQSITEGQETVQISNVRNISSIPSDDDIIVEAKYMPVKSGDTNKLSEIVLQNIPTTTFATTFVEPDDSTTEIKVEKDGSRKITLKKVIQPIEFIESSDLAKPFVTATINPESSVLTTTEKQAYKDQDSEPLQVVESILEDIQSEILDIIEQSGEMPSEEQKQDSKVLESVAQKVDLIASVVDTPNSNVESTQRTSEHDTNLTEPKCSSTTDDTKEPIMDISDVWPHLEDPAAKISTTTLKTLSPMGVQNEFPKTNETSDIWPNDMNTGSGYNTELSYFKKSYSTDTPPSHVVSEDKQYKNHIMPDITESADADANKTDDLCNLYVQQPGTTSKEIYISGRLTTSTTKEKNEPPSEISLIEPDSIQHSQSSAIADVDIHKSEVNYEQNVETSKPDITNLDEMIKQSIIQEHTIENIDQEESNRTQFNDAYKITEDEHGKQLQVQVSSLKDDQCGVTLSMNIDYTTDKNVKVSLVELDTAEKNIIPECEQTNEVEKTLESKEVEFQKGYEADKIMTDEEIEASNVFEVEQEKSFTETVVLEQREDKKETYDSTEKSDQPGIDSTEVIEECLLDSYELTTPLQCQIVLPTQIVETTYVENAYQQTTPIHKDSLPDETDHEIALITSDNFLVPLEFEQKSIQTSPENETVMITKHTSPDMSQCAIFDCKEVQTEINASEIETQTVDIAVKEHKEQNIQTELCMTKSTEEYESKSEACNVANQTMIVTTTETEMQTTEDLNQVVEPILVKIIDSTVELGIDKNRQSVQTSPITFNEDIIDKATPSDLQNEFVQTIGIDVVDVQTSTDSTFEDRGSSPVVPYAVADEKIQTSPIHDALATNDSKTAQPIHSQNSSVTVIDEDIERTPVVQIEKADAQAQTEPNLKSMESLAQGTQTVIVEQPTTSDLRKNKRKSKKEKKSNIIPIEFEVQTEVTIPECENYVEPVTITKTFVDSNPIDASNALNVQIQVELERPLQTFTYHQVNDEILEDKSWRINLADYFSIIRSQQSFTEDKVIPWSEIATMLSKIWSEKGNNTIKNSDYCLKSLPSKDYEGSLPDVVEVLSLLKQNDNVSEQDQLLFAELEKMNIEAEEISNSLCCITKLSETDHLHQQCLYRIKLHRILDRIKYLTKYAVENNIDSNHNITVSLEQTEKGIAQLAANISSELDMKQKSNESARIISTRLLQTRDRLYDIEAKTNDIISDQILPVNEKLNNLENNEECNNECIEHLITIFEIINTSDGIIDGTNLEEDFQQADQLSRKIQQTIIMERNKLLQLIGLAEEYEQTLLEFEEIAFAAAEFIANEISASSLKELEEEMQRYRKFFVNLSHCKMILESLESNLDPITRTKHADLHSALYNKTSIILERAVDRAARLAQAASKWTVLEKEMREETQWLQIAQQRIPDLQNVSSEDFEQYIKLYESLNQDILGHYSKLMQHSQISKMMQELIRAPTLQKDSSEALTKVTTLKEEVSLYLIKLHKFKNHWNRYNTAADTLHEWVCYAQKHLSSITFPQNLAETPVDDMRKFWEIKAQYEVMNNKVYEIACGSLDKALSIINIVDEQLQRQLYNQLLENWSSVSSNILDMQSHVYNCIKTSSTSSDEKITFIENELRDINLTFNNLKGVLKSSEDLYLYLEKIQTLKTRIHLIDTELGQIALATDFNVEKITELFDISTNASHQINEEHEAAENFYKCLEVIENGIKEQEKHFMNISKVLDECSEKLNGKKHDVEKSLEDCKICQSELSESWNEMMKLRQMLHTLPMNLKVTVSPQQTERDLSILQNIHSDLERKCESNMSQLRDRLVLWNKFHRQLETIQNHIQETEFMMDLIQLHETADYHRLLKATERLDALLAEIEHKKHTIDDLQNISKPLIESSEPSVSANIQETVQQITVLWQNTQENLHDLCQRYENAVKLWDRYNDICESVKECISKSVSNSNEHKGNHDIQVLRQYQHAVIDRTKDLEKLKLFIESINEQVGFNIGDTMISEIDEFARRMEDITEDIASQIKSTTSSHAEKEIIQTTYATSNTLVAQIQKDFNASLSDCDHSDKIMDLETHLLNLSATEACLKNIAHNKHDKNEDSNMYVNFKNLHTLSLDLLQDIITQHQDLLQQMVMQNKYQNLFKNWENFLNNITEHLGHEIPSDYCKLQQFRDQYNVIECLMRQWKTSILKISRMDSNLNDLYVMLNKRHNYCVQILNANLITIEETLLHWKNMTSLQLALHETITNIEAEKHNLQLEFINMKEFSKLITKVESLESRFCTLEVDLVKMNQEVDLLTSRLSDAQAHVTIKNDRDKILSRISKLTESVNTWKRFLMGVSELYSGFKSQCNQIEDSLNELGQCLNSFERDNPVTSQHHLNMLKNEKLRLVHIKEELLQINVAKENLQRCISSFDAKHVHKKVNNLWKLFEKHEHTVSTLLKQMEERTNNRKLFLNHYNILMEWITDYEKRLNDSNKYETCEEDANFIKSIEDMLLQEVSCKESEIAWFNVIGNDLLDALSPGEQQHSISSKLKFLNQAWEKLQRHCQDREQKISEVNSTTTLLQQRINDIRTWMSQIEWELKQPFVFENIEKGCLDKLLDDYEKLQRSIESNSGNIAEILNLCEMLFTDVESWNVHIDRKLISHTVNGLEVRWKQICIDTSKRKQDLLATWNILTEIQRILDSHQSWVEETNNFFDDMHNQVDAADNETLCRIQQSLSSKHAEIIGQESILQILKNMYISINKHERVERTNMHNITMTAKQMLLIWQKLVWKFNVIDTRIEELRNFFSSFINEYENIIVSLTQIDVKVTNIKHLEEERVAQTPETELQRLRDLHNELRFVINLFEPQDELGGSLIRLLPDNSIMSQEVQSRIAEYHQLANSIKTALDSLVKQTNFDDMDLKSERDYAVQVDTLPPLSITAKDAYLYQLQTALTEAKSNLVVFKTSISEINASNFMTSTQKISKASAACESSIELIKHLNVILKSECDCSDEEAMSSTIKQECDNYTLYLSEWQTKQQKLEELSPFPANYSIICVHNEDYLTCPLCTNRNWQQIDNDLWRLEQWLSMAETTQRSQHTQPSNDIDTLEDAIQDHREFLLDLDSHKSIIKSLNIIGEHLATHTLDTEKAVKLRERLQNDNKRWDKVCNQASHWQALLHKTLMENKEFHRTVTELSVWLEQTEYKIKTSEPIDLTMEKAVIERKFKTFMELRNDLVRCEPRIVSLQETTSQLTKYLDATTSQKFNEIYAKLTDLRLRFHSIRRLVEVYTVKIAAAIGYDGPLDTITFTAECSLRNQESSGSFSQVATNDANARRVDDEDHINTTVLTRSYRFLGRVLRASLPIQAMLLLLLGVATLMPHGEDYSCSFTNNFARSLEPMLRYPNGPPPI